MRLDQTILDELRVAPGSPARLAERSTSDTIAEWAGSRTGRRKRGKGARKELASFVDELSTAQTLLWASNAYALLIVLQGMDASGKDGTIRHVMSGVNPQGCQVASFGPPTPEERSHHFLWRCSRVVPARGRIGIFNRSYYEDVVVVRVHPELLAATGGFTSSAALWEERFDDINAFERTLDRNRTRIVKIFLHVSPEEQKRRLLRRLDDPDKVWKFSSSDLEGPRRWGEYQDAYERALTATSTTWAPWYVVPADHKSALRALVGGIVVDAVDRMELRRPTADPRLADEREQARKELAGG
jgi:PPK2 family polyphosphate:nucleotide phosphotransferase